jgi:hypothetical protein
MAPATGKLSGTSIAPADVTQYLVIPFQNSRVCMVYILCLHPSIVKLKLSKTLGLVRKACTTCPIPRHGSERPLLDVNRSPPST